MVYDIQKEYDTIAGLVYEGTEEEPSESCFNDYLEDKDYDVMQFTGLLDKNGKEIYEGDITDKGVIEFQTNLNWDSGGSLHSGFYFKTYNNEGELDYHSSLDDCEVIGNIYENGDLLK